MSKILVLYHSNTGNTASMAKLIAKGASQNDFHHTMVRYVLWNPGLKNEACL